MRVSAKENYIDGVIEDAISRMAISSSIAALWVCNVVRFSLRFRRNLVSVLSLRKYFPGAKEA